MECEYCHRKVGETNTVCLSCGERTHYYAIRNVALAFIFIWVNGLIYAGYFGAALSSNPEDMSETWMMIRISCIILMVIIFFGLYLAVGPNFLYSCQRCNKKNPGPVYSCPYCENRMVFHNMNDHYMALIIGIILALINIPLLSIGLEAAFAIPIGSLFLVLIGGLVIQVMRYNSAMLTLKNDMKHSSKKKVCPRCKYDENLNHSQYCANCGMPFWERKFRSIPNTPHANPAQIGYNGSGAVGTKYPINASTDNQTMKIDDTMGKTEEKVAWVLAILGLILSFCFGIGIVFGISAIIVGKKAQRLTSSYRGNDPITIGYVDIVIGAVILFLILLLPF